MSGLFRRLADRAQGRAALLQPRRPGPFEPEADAADVPDEPWAEPAAAASPSPGTAVSPIGQNTLPSGTDPTVSLGSTAAAVVEPSAPASPFLPVDGPARRPSAPSRAASSAAAPLPSVPTTVPATPSGAHAVEPAPHAVTPPLPATRAAATPMVSRSTAVPTSPPASAGLPPSIPPRPDPAPATAASTERRSPTAPLPADTVRPANAPTSSGDGPEPAVGQAAKAPLVTAPSRFHGAPAATAPAPVEIAIGRVEVRFAPPAPAPAKATSRSVGPPPLADLLRGGRGGGR